MCQIRFLLFLFILARLHRYGTIYILCFVFQDKIRVNTIFNRTSTSRRNSPTFGILPFSNFLAPSAYSAQKLIQGLGKHWQTVTECGCTYYSNSIKYTFRNNMATVSGNNMKVAFGQWGIYFVT